MEMPKFRQSLQSAMMRVTMRRRWRKTERWRSRRMELNNSDGGEEGH